MNTTPLSRIPLEKLELNRARYKAEIAQGVFAGNQRMPKAPEEIEGFSFAPTSKSRS